jgi:hypothetical protein
MPLLTDSIHLVFVIACFEHTDTINSMISLGFWFEKVSPYTTSIDIREAGGLLP